MVSKLLIVVFYSVEMILNVRKTDNFIMTYKITTNRFIIQISPPDSEFSPCIIVSNIFRTT